MFHLPRFAIVFLVIANLGSLVSAQTDCPIRLVGKSGGYALAGANAGDVLFISQQYRLVALDWSDRDNLVVLGQIELPDIIREITISNGIAFVCCTSHGLQIVDVADPARMRRIGAVGNAQQMRAFDAEIYGNYCYVASYYGQSEIGHIDVVDITDITQPTIVNTISDWSLRLVINSGYLYSFSLYSNVHVYSLDNPLQPELVGSWDDPAIRILDATFTGHIVTTVGFGTIARYELHNPGPPSLLTSRTSSAAHVIYGQGLYSLGSSTATIHNSVTLAPIATVPIDGSVRDFCVDGNIMAAVAEQVVQVVQSTGTSLVPRGRYFTTDVNSELAEVGDYVLVPTYAGLVTFDASDPRNPRPIARSQYYLSNIRVHENVLYGSLAMQPPRLGLFNIDDPTMLQQISAIDFTLTDRPLIDGSFIYAPKSTGFSIIDISDNQAPIVVGNYLSGLAETIWMPLAKTGNIVYQAIGRRLHIVDVSSPAVPTRVGSIQFPNSIYSLAIAGDRMFAPLDGGGGLLVLDISTPATPTQATIIPGTFSGVKISNQRLIATGFPVSIFDLSDPSSLNLIAAGERGGPVAVVRDFLVVGKGSAGIATLVLNSAADLDLNGIVDLQDLATLLANFALANALPQEGDTDNDGDVDLQDLANLLAAFSVTCP